MVAKCARLYVVIEKDSCSFLNSLEILTNLCKSLVEDLLVNSCRNECFNSFLVFQKLEVRGNLLLRVFHFTDILTSIFFFILLTSVLDLSFESLLLGILKHFQSHGR